MSRPRPVPIPSRLSKLLERFKSAHPPVLTGVKAMKLTFAFRNDHFGARRFVQLNLPLIRYANPYLNIEVNRVPKTKEDIWKPEMTLKLQSGATETIDMDKKWSSTIYEEVLDLAGGESWQKWKAQRKAQGLPAVDVPLPKAPTSARKRKNDDLLSVTSPFRIDPTKTGAAAVLP